MAMLCATYVIMFTRPRVYTESGELHVSRFSVRDSLKKGKVIMYLDLCCSSYDLILKEAPPLIVATERERHRQAVVALRYQKP